jgi:hypothetical protein
MQLLENSRLERNGINNEYFEKECVVASYEGQKSVDFCKSIEMSRKVLK